MTLRAITIGLFAQLAVVVIVSYAELVTGRIMIGFLQLPPVVVALLFVLILVNKVVGRVKPSWILKPAEIAVAHCMMLIASMVASRGVMERLIATMVGVRYYENDANQWSTLFFPHIRPWAVPWRHTSDEAPVARYFYEGLPAGEPIPWAAWVLPLAGWMALYLIVFGAFLCLATILYRQWSHHEKLTFPLVALPLEMIQSRGGESFWRSKLMWTGVGVSVFVFGLNGLHEIWPVVPALKLQTPLNPFFVQRPWNACGYFVLFLSPAATGLFYLLPTDLLFSLWSLFLFSLMQQMTLNAFGHPDPLSATTYETAGAYVLLVCYWVWAGRTHLRQVGLRALGRDGAQDQAELMPYRLAVIGLAVCLVAAVAWFRALGMSVGLAAFTLLVYVFVECLVMARSTTEGGLPMTEGSFRPNDLFVMWRPTETLGAGNLTALAFVDALFTRDLRGLVLTGFLDGQRLADGTGVRRRNLLAVFGLATVVALLSSAVVHLWLPYHRGAVQMYSYVYWGNNVQFFREYGTALVQGAKQPPAALTSFLVGGLLTWGLALARLHLFWWPLHPLGLALSRSWTCMVFWFPIFLAWAVKWPLARYGGMSMLRRARPFFLGLIFGEFCMAVFWTLVSMAFGTTAPLFPWP